MESRRVIINYGRCYKINRPRDQSSVGLSTEVGERKHGKEDERKKIKDE